MAMKLFFRADLGGVSSEECRWLVGNLPREYTQLHTTYTNGRYHAVLCSIPNKTGSRDENDLIAQVLRFTAEMRYKTPIAVSFARMRYYTPTGSGAYTVIYGSATITGDSVERGAAAQAAPPPSTCLDTIALMAQTVKEVAPKLERIAAGAHTALQMGSGQIELVDTDEHCSDDIIGIIRPCTRKDAPTSFEVLYLDISTGRGFIPIAAPFTSITSAVITLLTIPERLVVIEELFI